MEKIVPKSTPLILRESFAIKWGKIAEYVKKIHNPKRGTSKNSPSFRGPNLKELLSPVVCPKKGIITLIH